MKELVIDFHVHLAAYENLSASTFEFGASAYPSPEDYTAYCRKYSDPRSFIELMDENGVDYTVVLAEYAPLTTGIASNEKVEAFCRANPRLIPFCSFNPFLHDNMGKKLEDLCLNHGFKGLKLYPTYNHFYPNDNFMYPVYSVAEKLGIPVLFHTGSSIFANSRIKYGDPILLDDVAVDFPNLKLIMAHGGRGPWYDEAMTMIRLHKNVYIDVTGLPPFKLTEFYPDIGRFAHKFIFGTDWPAVDVRKNIQMIRDLPISGQAIARILGGNARQLLGLG
ncbi:MAG: amidohydrolase [Syntrophomonadaceae bacterium]|nr:amidohydrolase [Syntrophomonadaceae bacterium]